jgi:(2Fe-2S) ferredoxin
MKYKKHIFICTNQRPDGARVCCGEDKGMNIVREFKKRMKDKGLNKNMRAQRTGCLDMCEHGPSVVVYPDGVFYGNVTVNDVPEIIDSHLVENRIVERLKIKEEE